MKSIRRLLAALTAVLMTAIPLGSLAVNTAPTEAVTSESTGDWFTDRDLSGEWDEAEAESIVFTGSGAECDSESVSVQGSTVTITSEGTYVLSGALDGSVVVDAKDQKVQLVLNGAAISAEGTAALLVEDADKVFVTLAEGTDNTLAVTGSFDEESSVDAAVFSRDDITFNGSGSLTVTCENGNGIVSKDDLKFASGTYAVTASGRALDANDSVRVAGGSFTLNSLKDAIRAKSDENGKGHIVILGGAFEIVSGGGSVNAAPHAQGSRGFGREASSVSEGAQDSAKGIKASASITILDGSFSINSADDAIHTDGDLTVSGGVFDLSSGDDGMHANDALTISGGTVTISSSYEGTEAGTISIEGGDIKVYASDDGLNAAGGADGSGYGFYDMFSSQSGVAITISGGSLYVNSGGDGIDSNGDLIISGGSVVVSGPTNSGNGALDYNGTGAITGGTVIAAGAAGMGQNFSQASTQVSALVSLSGGAGAITVTDENGDILLSGTVEKSYECVVISCPELAVNGNYTVSSGSTSVSLTPASAVSGGMGGMRGGMGQNGGSAEQNGGMGQNGGRRGGRQGGGPRGGMGPGGMGQDNGTGQNGGMGQDGMGQDNSTDQNGGTGGQMFAPPAENTWGY